MDKGYSKYYQDEECRFKYAYGSFERPAPESTDIDGKGAENGQNHHLLRAELWLLTWLERAGFKADVFTDIDFDRGINNLHNYKALVLNTHPEYWTIRMWDNLHNYLKQGGCLLYLGGNGIYETCQYENEEGKGLRLKFFNGQPTDNRDKYYFRNQGMPEREVLGVAFLGHCGSSSINDKSRGPYKVREPDHWIFQGSRTRDRDRGALRFKMGETIGESGYLGPASGWEMDTSEPGTAPDKTTVRGLWGDDRGVPPKNLVLLARGQTECDCNLSADMTYYDHRGGGFVFSVGSLCFTGSLAKEEKLQQIVANALKGAQDKNYRILPNAKK